MRKHSEILIPRKENHMLDHNRGGTEVADLVASLYDLVQNSTNNSEGNKVGIKDPHLWTADYVEKYHRYFPRTKIVFGLRHPVTWFNRYVPVCVCVCVCVSVSITTVSSLRIRLLLGNLLHIVLGGVLFSVFRCCLLELLPHISLFCSYVCLLYFVSNLMKYVQLSCPGRTFT